MSLQTIGNLKRRVVLTDENGNPISISGVGAKVILYNSSNQPIHDTTEGVGQAIDAHLTNPTIEQTTGAATNNKNIQAGFVDETGSLRPPLVDSVTRRIQADIKKVLSASGPTFATVGVASAQVIAANSTRKGLVFVNTSVNVISFGIGAAAVLNSGITLGPLGVWEMDADTFSTAAINAIAAAASSNLALQEMT